LATTLGEFWVESILKHSKKKKAGQLLYYVSWLNYPESENCWVEEYDIGEHYQLEYWRRVGMWTCHNFFYSWVKSDSILPGDFSKISDSTR